jgi:hypothetical protein
MDKAIEQLGAAISYKSWVSWIVRSIHRRAEPAVHAIDQGGVIRGQNQKASLAESGGGELGMTAA